MNNQVESLFTPTAEDFRCRFEDAANPRIRPDRPHEFGVEAKGLVRFYENQLWEVPKCIIPCENESVKETIVLVETGEGIKDIAFIKISLECVFGHLPTLLIVLP